MKEKRAGSVERAESWGLVEIYHSPSYFPKSVHDSVIELGHGKDSVKVSRTSCLPDKRLSAEVALPPSSSWTQLPRGLLSLGLSHPPQPLSPRLPLGNCGAIRLLSNCKGLGRTEGGTQITKQQETDCLLTD